MPNYIFDFFVCLKIIIIRAVPEGQSLHQVPELTLHLFARHSTLHISSDLITDGIITNSVSLQPF